MENNVYERVAEYLTLMGRTELLTCSAMQNSFSTIRDQAKQLMGRTELLTCSAMQNSFSTIRDQAKQLTREYNLQCCYLFYPVLKQHIQYDFEACDNDPVTVVTADHESAAATLSKEARRLANKIARENNNIKECFRKLQNYSAMRESGQKVDPSDPNGPDLETKIEEMKLNIRRSETTKMKAEARIETLRAGGVNVDEWLQEAETLNVQDIQRSTSSLSMRTDASGTGDHANSDPFYDSDFADEQTSMPMERMDREDSHKDDSQEVDAMLEQERQRIEQLTAGWEDPTQVDWGVDDTIGTEGVSRERTPSEPVIKCTALYSYTAQNPDELTIVENEQLEVIGEGDGDGWLRARNYKGEEGYVPHNYLDVETEHTTTTPGLVTQISFSSVDYTVDNEDETNQSPEQASVIAAVPQETAPDLVSYCCALYDYDGEGEEELTFEEGQVIKVLSKHPHGVDDGWWRGEVEGRAGNFPSLVVEECDEYGEPLTNQWDETPPCSAPPVFTPPEIPEFLREADGVPEEISPAEESQIIINKQESEPEVPPIVVEPTNAGFSMELSRDQQEHYGSQFQGNNVPRWRGNNGR
ncbi:Variant SH3 domain [Popillia japonica]|uniref:Variant SH3 domain n=1 Tax=Popillia japonica TaxID=7064 RepID=A0AAW1MQW5_POPJA